MSSLVSGIFGGGKKEAPAPLPAPEPVRAASTDIATREQASGQRVAGAAADTEVDALGNAVPKKKQAGRELLG